MFTFATDSLEASAVVWGGKILLVFGVSHPGVLGPEANSKKRRVPVRGFGDADGDGWERNQKPGISLIVSFLVLFLLTRRIMPAIIVLFPVGIASLWVVGSMALIGLKWNVLTVMVTALTLGIGIDYSIHMWRRFEVELKKRGDHWGALKEALDTTGVALMLSATTTMAGFAVLLFSPMPIIQDFGLITAITVLFSLVLALMVLPVLVELSARGEESASEDGTG
ncbi:MAG: hypothetical protein CM15mP78_08740 [Candidatus Poseidoniales archaeon]|nr:MAG: hypothetical protein CM15mP78_08740 [Candidatus Poseidoniales archaeon]